MNRSRDKSRTPPKYNNNKQEKIPPTKPPVKPSNEKENNIFARPPAKTNFNTNANRKVVLDISDDGDIVDNTGRRKESSDYEFTPSDNKVKYQFKPKKKSSPVNDSFG